MERRELMPHQKEMVEFSLEKGNDPWVVEMRLGKTLADVREVQERDEPFPQLAIVPGNVMNAWEKELTLEREDFVRGYSLNRKKRIDAVNYVFNQPKRTWLLINFEALITIPGIVDLKWGKVRVDESSKIKDASTKTSQLISDHFANTRYRGIRTGLISPEHELDIFQQMKFVYGSFLSCRSYWKFRSNYFEKNGYDWIPKKGMRSAIKNAFHERCFVKTRKQAGIDKKKFHQKRLVEMNPTQKKLYDQIFSDFEYELDSIINSDSIEPIPDKYIETIWATGRALWLARIAGGFTPQCEQVISTAKPDQIIELLKTDLKGEPIVVWYRFLDELFHDRTYFESKGFSTATMAGQDLNKEGKRKIVLPSQRFIEEEKFNSGKAQILLCVQKLAAQGKDFSKASVGIYRSEEYSADLYIQSEDRILHPTKPDNGLLYIHLLCEGTVDITARQLIDEKVYNARDFLISFRKMAKQHRYGQQELPSFQEFMREIAEDKYYEKVI